MISKELLSEVLGSEIHEILGVASGELQYSKRHLADGTPYCVYHKINIHELAHKCKEWAEKKHMIIIYSAIGYAKVSYICDLKGDNDKCFDADTETEAIFKACEWILKENKC